MKIRNPNIWKPAEVLTQKQYSKQRFQSKDNVTHTINDIHDTIIMESFNV